jgi:hypothetical protein
MMFLKVAKVAVSNFSLNVHIFLQNCQLFVLLFMTLIPVAVPFLHASIWNISDIEDKNKKHNFKNWISWNSKALITLFPINSLLSAIIFILLDFR